MAEHILAKENMKVTCLRSGQELLDFVQDNNPDLILLDYEMPICSGPDLLELIRADSSNADIPVMFLTGKGDRESVNKVLSLHPQGYMLKTITRPDMLKTLAEFFEKDDARKAEEAKKEPLTDPLSLLSGYLKNK